MKIKCACLAVADEQHVLEVIERTRERLNRLYESRQIINEEIIELSQELDELIVQATAIKMNNKSTIAAAGQDQNNQRRSADNGPL